MRPGRLCAHRGAQPAPQRSSSRLAGLTDHDGPVSPEVTDGYVLRLGEPAVAVALHKLRWPRDEAPMGLHVVSSLPRRHGPESQEVALRLRLRTKEPTLASALFTIACGRTTARSQAWCGIGMGLPPTAARGHACSDTAINPAARLGGSDTRSAVRLPPRAAHTRQVSPERASHMALALAGSGAAARPERHRVGPTVHRGGGLRATPRVQCHALTPRVPPSDSNAAHSARRT